MSRYRASRVRRARVKMRALTGDPSAKKSRCSEVFGKNRHWNDLYGQVNSEI